MAGADVPLRFQCARCRHRFDPDKEGRAGIYIDRGGEGAEKLLHQEVVHLCGGCAVALRTWVGMRPDVVYRF